MKSSGVTNALFDITRCKLAPVGKNNFTIPANGLREIIFTLIAGQDFTRQEVGVVQDFTIEAFFDDLPIGGMTYHIDPKILSVPQEI